MKFVAGVVFDRHCAGWRAAPSKFSVENYIVSSKNYTKKEFHYHFI